METKDNWVKDLWKSIIEHDVMQLRNKLNEIQIYTENQLKSFNMNRTGDADYIS